MDPPHSHNGKTSLDDVFNAIHGEEGTVPICHLMWLVEEICLDCNDAKIEDLWNHSSLQRLTRNPIKTDCDVKVALRVVDDITSWLGRATTGRCFPQKQDEFPNLSQLEMLALDGPWWANGKNVELKDSFNESHCRGYLQRMEAAAIRYRKLTGQEVSWAEIAEIACRRSREVQSPRSTPEHIARHVIGHMLKVDPNTLLPTTQELVQSMAQKLLLGGKSCDASDLENYSVYRAAHGGYEGQWLHSQVIVSQRNNLKGDRSHLGCIKSIRRAAGAIGAALVKFKTH